MSNDLLTISHGSVRKYLKSYLNRFKQEDNYINRQNNNLTLFTPSQSGTSSSESKIWIKIAKIVGKYFFVY